MKADYHKEYIQNKSYWELSEWTEHFDFIVIGAGFTGLYTALEIIKRQPKSRVAILDQANRFGGASTRNAGFICFGSPSEIMADVETAGREATIHLIKNRYRGMRRLRKWLPEEAVEMTWSGGIEVVPENTSHEDIPLPEVNNIIEQATGLPGAYQSYPASQFGINSSDQVFYTEYEGAMNPAKAVQYLTGQCLSKGVEIIRGCEVLSVEPGSPHHLETTLGSFRAEFLAVCTNAYSGALIPESDVRPAKNQVYVTSAVRHKLVGTYHMNAGYVYFRPMGERILIGGARHLEGDDETPLTYNPEIESFLEAILKRYVCPGQSVTFEHRWIGHIGVGNEKSPLVKTLLKGIVCGVRLSGMGVALAPALAEEITDRLFKGEEAV